MIVTLKAFVHFHDTYQHLFHLLKLPGHDGDVMQFFHFIAAKKAGAKNGQYGEAQIGQVF
jgi:hypothetical protein